MEEKITNILDNLTLTEVEKLLNEDIKFDIDPKSLNRMKDSVYQKIEIKRQRRSFEKLITVAAAFVIVIFLLFTVGFDPVEAAIQKLFSFIPEYGIIEDNQSIEYILSETAAVENNDLIFTLNNAIANKDSITVMLSLERKNDAEEQLLNGKKEEEQIKNDMTPSRPKASLYVNGMRYTEYSGVTSGGGLVETSVFTYTLKAENIDTNTIYELVYDDFDLSLEFKLKNYNSYNTLSEIGPTAYKNNISITAVPTFKDNKVEVNIYPINKSRFVIDSFFQHDTGYLNNDLHLETNSGVKEYILPDGYGSAHGKFTFEIEPSDNEFILKIPFIVVQSVEEQNITLKIPKKGEIIKTNYKVDFKDCTVTIVELEKTSEHIGDDGELKMTFKYDNKAPNKIMVGTNINRTDIFGRIKGGGYASEIDENGITTTVYYALEKGENNKLRLKLSHPVYYLTDEYELKFNR